MTGLGIVVDKKRGVGGGGTSSLDFLALEETQMFVSCNSWVQRNTEVDAVALEFVVQFTQGCWGMDGIYWHFEE